MSAQLRVARGLSFDPDYYGGGTFALLGKKGAGKSFAARVLAEELWATRVPFVKFDPMGVAYGLRSSADGKSKGIPVPIFGGSHGDAPLERTGGAVLADLVVQDGLSMVLDLSLLGSHAAEREFVLAFLERLYRTNQRLVHLLIDEADMFAPQSKQHGDERLLGVMENIVRRGRNRGIGCTMLTQRPAVLNKDVLTQVDGLALLRITSPQDRAAADEWMKGHADQAQAAEVKRSLASLANGEAWWWVPELDVLKRVQIRMSRTFDSSPTRKRDERREAPKSVAEVDLAAITERMTATVERAKANDPAELRKQLAEMTRTKDAVLRDAAQAVRERDEARGAPPAPFTTEEFTLAIEDAKGVIDEVARARSRVASLEDVPLRQVGEQREAVEEAVVDASRYAERLFTTLRGWGEPGPPQNRAVPPARPRTPAPTPAPRTAPERRQEAPETNGSSNGHITGPQQRVLDAVAWLSSIVDDQPTKMQVGFIAGYRVGKKVGGTYGNILGQLRSEGYIDYPSAGAVTLTEKGAAIAEAPNYAPTDDGVQQAIMARLNGPEQRVLQVILDAHPNPLDKQEVGARAGYTVGGKVGGTFGNILGKLRTLGLIDYPAPGQVAVTDAMFV